MSIGNRGKYAEGVFRKWAKAKSDANIDFAFYRFPDARAGSLSTVPSDFEVLHRGLHFNFEIKEVDHAFRLPHSNFSKDKVARMRKFEMAGSKAIVLVYFTPTKMWRVKPVQWFFEQQNEGASWSMSEVPMKTFLHAMQDIFGAL